MIDRLITFCLTHMDVFDGLILGILFTLLCKWLEKKFSKPKQVVVNVAEPTDFTLERGGSACMARALDANRDSIERSMGVPADKTKL